MRMVSIMEKNFVIEVFRDTFKKVLYSSIGESVCEAIIFFLHRELNRDPFEVFWENPRTVYHAMKKILGVGAEILINTFVERVNQEYGLSMRAERFLSLMCNSNQNSIEEVRDFLREIAELHRERNRE